MVSDVSLHPYSEVRLPPDTHYSVGQNILEKLRALYDAERVQTPGKAVQVEHIWLTLG